MVSAALRRGRCAAEGPPSPQSSVISVVSRSDASLALTPRSPPLPSLIAIAKPVSDTLLSWCFKSSEPCANPFAMDGRNVLALLLLLLAGPIFINGKSSPNLDTFLFSPESGFYRFLTKSL